VQGIDKPGVRAGPGDVGDGPADVLKALAKTLPAMACDEDDALGEVQEGKEVLVGADVPFDDVQAHMESVDDGITHDIDVFRDALPGEILRRTGGGGKVPVRETAGDEPVEFFGERGVFAAAAKARLQVGHGDLFVEGGQGTSHDGGGVPLDEHQVRRGPLQYVFQTGEAPGRDVEERLIRRHQVQVVVRGNAEEGVDLVQHLPVLAGKADLDGEDVGAPAEGGNEGGHLDGLGAGAVDEEEGHATSCYRGIYPFLYD